MRGVCPFLLLSRSSWPITSAPGWSRGRDGGRALRRWRCGRGSCCWRPTPEQHADRRAPGDRSRAPRKWRSRFLEHRLDGCSTSRAPGALGQSATRGRAGHRPHARDARPRTPRTGRRGRSPRGRVTQSAVLRIRRAFGLQPHRRRDLAALQGPAVHRKVRDIVGLYMDPPERAVVLCVDEKSQIQALDRTAPILPMLPGTPERATHDYKRAGTSSLYAALDIATGQVIGSLHARHRAIEFKKFLAHDRPRGPGPASSPPRARQLAQPTRRRRSRNGWPRTRASSCTSRPTSSSWLNLVERWFAELTTKKLQPRHPPLGPPAQHRHPRLDRHLEPRTPDPSSGPRPPTRSSTPLPATAHE